MQRPNDLFDDGGGFFSNQTEESFGGRKNTLALRLQQRRPRKALVDQGIIPPLKSPATYFEQRQKLERARTGDFLNKKIQGRPERDALIAKHILEDTSAYDSIVANQKELKKAKLVDDLNEKIAFRPGVIELVQKNIIQTDDSLQEAIKEGQVKFRPTTSDDLDGDSSDAFSPEPSYQSSQGEGSGLSQPMKTSESSPPLVAIQQTQFSSFPSSHQNHIDSSWSNKISSSRLDATNSIVTSSSKISLSSSHVNTHPYLFRQSSGTKNTKTTQSSKRNVRKQKDKPKFKRYKYHQYIPPDQQGKQTSEKDVPNMNSHYNRVLEQQQLYLQLQIMHQHYPTILPSPQATGDKQLQDINKTFIPQVPTPPPPPPSTTTATNSNRNNMGDARKRVFTEQQLEDMKVAELKEELKARSLKVTGTKEVLVERLKPFAIQTMQASTLQPISRDIKSLINATIESTMRSNAEMAAAKTGQVGAVLLRQQNNNNQQMFKSSDVPQITTSMPNQASNNSTQRIPNNISTAANSRPTSVVPMDSSCSSQSTTEANFQFTGSFNHQSHQQNNHNNQPQQRQWANNNGENQAINFVAEGASQPGGNPHVVKNQLLQEIEDLRRMVDLHKTQIRQMQVQPQPGMHDGSTTLQTNGSTGTTQQQQYHMHNSNSSDTLAQENSHQEIAQMLQQHLASKIQKGPIYQHDQQMVKQERSPPVVINDSAHYAFANSPPNVTLVPLKTSTNRIPSPHVMRSSSHDNSFQTHDNKQPPKYAEAIQDKHLHKSNPSPNPPSFTDSMPPPHDMYMDDLLELLADKGEIPFEEQMENKINEQIDTKPALLGYNMNEMHYMQQNNKPATPQQKLQMRRSFPMLEYNENNIPIMHETPQTLNRRHSEDLLAQPSAQNSNQQQSQFRQMLVNSAGDILMDNNLVPPPTSVAHRVHQPGCMPPEAVTLPQYDSRGTYNNNYAMFGDSNTMLQQQHRRIGGSDPNLLQDPYNSQPFSPMDTNSCDGSRHVHVVDENRMRDPHLSASSIHDSEPALDKACNIPNNTSSCVRKYKQLLASESPRPSNSLTKSSSQELLSTTPHTPHDQSMQVDELKWLDLTFDPPLPGPPLPLNHGHPCYHRSNESFLESEDNSLPLSSSLQSFETPSSYVSHTGLSPNEFSIDLMDLNPITSPTIDTWDKMLSS